MELNLEEVAKHPYRPENWLPLFRQCWERQGGEE
jgi:galactonate dehydratase